MIARCNPSIQPSSLPVKVSALSFNVLKFKSANSGGEKSFECPAKITLNNVEPDLGADKIKIVFLILDSLLAINCFSFSISSVD
ncbi:hypothetical protein BMS3Abin04_01767 [bacterium BMS3Abin04]|nr:hypothetical protein BMS3Abin04_01767 [bacterium BMS3Abin04]